MQNKAKSSLVFKCLLQICIKNQKHLILLYVKIIKLCYKIKILRKFLHELYSVVKTHKNKRSDLPLRLFFLTYIINLDNIYNPY